MADRASPILIEEFSLGGEGPTVAIKDCIDIAGHRTTGGSATLADEPPAGRHADVVAALIAHGARIVGKANMHELAYGVTGVNGWLGTPVNPAYPSLIPGGSSSGAAAAVAAGLAEIAIGTDTGGSIRMPAACCGVFGLKPTFGRISRRGCVPAVSSLDCVGPFARDVTGIERAMAMIDAGFVVQTPPAAVTFGLVYTPADPDISAAVSAQLDRAAIALRTVSLPGMDEAFQAGMTIIAAESWAAFAHLVERPGMGDDVRARLLAAGRITPEQVAEAEEVRRRFTASVDEALEGIDALVLPTLPATPPALEELGDAARILRLTLLVRPFNLSGHPALTIPIPGPAGRPAGVQLVGKHGGDAALCAVAHLVAAGVRSS